MDGGGCESGRGSGGDGIKSEVTRFCKAVEVEVEIGFVGGRREVAEVELGVGGGSVSVKVEERASEVEVKVVSRGCGARVSGLRWM